jgi:hypothetical protein
MYLHSIKKISGIFPAGKTHLQRFIYLHIANILEKFRILHMQFAILLSKVTEWFMEYRKVQYIN